MLRQSNASTGTSLKEIRRLEGSGEERALRRIAAAAGKNLAFRRVSTGISSHGPYIEVSGVSRGAFSKKGTFLFGKHELHWIEGRNTPPGKFAEHDAICDVYDSASRSEAKAALRVVARKLVENPDEKPQFRVAVATYESDTVIPSIEWTGDAFPMPSRRIRQ